MTCECAVEFQRRRASWFSLSSQYRTSIHSSVVSPSQSLFNAGI